MKKFKITVIMAVYNVSPFIRDAVESILNQDIGFEKNVQVILVNDGSTDGSDAICQEYTDMYPENFLYICKVHEGTAGARNTGIPHIKGQFVNFMDADDKLSPNTFSQVINFFQQNDVDIVSIPIQRFDGRNGGHPLNCKYESGTRTIDLDREPDAIQLSMSSAFIPARIAQNILFDTRLSYAEDAKVALQILSATRKLGVISECRYLYRLRTKGEPSAIQQSSYNSKWYLDYIRFFTFDTLDWAVKKWGYIPEYIQHALMYDLQWKLIDDHSQEILEPEKQQEYISLFAKCLQYFSDDIITAQKHLSPIYKLFLLILKYRNYSFAVLQNNRLCCEFGSSTNLSIDILLHIDFIYIRDGILSIEGYFSYPAVLREAIQPCFEVNNETITTKPVNPSAKSYHSAFVFGKELEKHYGFIFTHALEPGKKLYKITPLCIMGREKIAVTAWDFGMFSPVNVHYKNSYYSANQWQLKIREGCIQIAYGKLMLQIYNEIKFLKEISHSKHGSIQAICLRVLCWLIKPMKKKKVWLVSDRINKADDNGEAFLEYLNRQHNSKIRSYFLLNKNSADYPRLRKKGKVIQYFSFRHKLLYLLSDCVISAHADHYTTNPFLKEIDMYRDLMTDQTFIFLQHGIIKDDLSDWLNRFNKNIKGFITSNIREYLSVINGNYDYDEKTVWLTGLPRYDYRTNDPRRLITIMPTWRKYLLSGFSEKTGTRGHIPSFAESDYYKFYSSLISDERLIREARKHNYTICFMPHPNMAPHIDLFPHHEEVLFFSLADRYQDVFSWSELLITDFSSVAFDFAYLHKPVIYAQFDSDVFFSGAHPYTKGYFDYSADGFGEVETTLTATIDRIIEYMQNGCQLKPKYRERIDNFFAFCDTNCCERIYQKILHEYPEKVL